MPSDQELENYASTIRNRVYKHLHGRHDQTSHMGMEIPDESETVPVKAAQVREGDHVHVQHRGRSFHGRVWGKDQDEQGNPRFYIDHRDVATTPFTDDNSTTRRVSKQPDSLGGLLNHLNQSPNAYTTSQHQQLENYLRSPASEGLSPKIQQQIRDNAAFNDLSHLLPTSRIGSMDEQAPPTESRILDVIQAEQNRQNASIDPAQVLYHPYSRLSRLANNPEGVFNKTIPGMTSFLKSEESEQRYLFYGDLTTITKADEEKRYTFSVVYEASPSETKPILDAHAEFSLASELERALWGYVDAGDRTIYIQHGTTKVGMRKAGRWVEIVAWPWPVTTRFSVPGKAPSMRTVPAGSVWMGVIWEREIWDLVKSGKITGYSFGGVARRKTYDDND
jgi:hypothetical protein